MNTVGEGLHVSALGARAVKVVGSVKVNAGFLQDGTELAAPEIDVAARTVQEQDCRAFPRMFKAVSSRKFLSGEADTVIV